MIKNRSLSRKNMLLFLILVFGVFTVGIKLLREGSIFTNNQSNNQGLTMQSDQSILTSTNIVQTEDPTEFHVLPKLPVIASVSQNEVTVSVVWVYADTTRVAIEYEIDGVNVPEGFMLPCPVFRAVLGENGTLYPEYIYAEPTNDIRTHCMYSEQGTYSVLQSFYRSHASETKINLRFEVAVGGMTLYNESGSTIRYPQAGVFSFDLTVNTTGQWTIEQSQSSNANNITTTLQKVELNPSLADVYMCIEFRNDQEWIPEASLLIGNDQATLELYEQVDQGGVPFIDLSSTRCFRLTFATEKELQSGDSLTVEINKLIVDAFNVMTEDDCANALHNIQQKYPEVNFVCYFDNRGGGSGWGFEVISRPSSMGEDQVFELFRSELKREITGPWSFSITVP